MQFKQHPPSGGFGDTSAVNYDVFDAQTIIDKVASNYLLNATAPVLSTLTTAAANVYGLTSTNLLQAQGKYNETGRMKQAAHMHKTALPQ